MADKYYALSIELRLLTEELHYACEANTQIQYNTELRVGLKYMHGQDMHVMLRIKHNNTELMIKTSLDRSENMLS